MPESGARVVPAPWGGIGDECMGLSRHLRREMGMSTNTKTTGDRKPPKFEGLEVAIEIVGSLRNVVISIRRHDTKLAQQIIGSASSIAANLAEGNRRTGRDRMNFFRIAAGSADETLG